MMNNNEFREAVRNMRRSPTLLERSGEYWSDEDKEKVNKLFNEGTGITEIAMILQRSETAVMQQIEKQDLYGRKSFPTRQRTCSATAKCLCNTCSADPALCPLRSVYRSNQEDA